VGKLTDLFEVARGGGEVTPDSASHVVPREPNRDIFIADFVNCALKDDWHSMEHPMFTLSKTPDLKERYYEHNGNSITITPSVKGLATIWDKDILIFAISQLIEALNQNRQPSRTIQMVPRALLVGINRHAGGGDYRQLEAALDRLAGTRIRTNIVTDGERIRHAFGIIDEWKTVEKTATGRMAKIEVTLSQWLYNAVLAREVLTLDRAYFTLSGALERRLYELARKHCGRQRQWRVSLELLHKKAGTTATLKELRRKVKKIAEANPLPGYQLGYESKADMLLFCSR
jgi:plasmid replication initiation protein